VPTKLAMTIGCSVIATVLVVGALVGSWIYLESVTEGPDLTVHGERSYNL